MLRVSTVHQYQARRNLAAVEGGVTLSIGRRNSTCARDPR
jgi:hypothetical protein